MHGISGFKINALLIYSCVLCLILIIPQRYNRSSKAPAFKKICFASILSASAAGLLTFIEVVCKFNLPPGRYAFYFKDHYHTINDFSHLHTTKVLMYYAVQLLHLNYINETVDTALALAPHVNVAVIVLLAFCTIAVIACCILLVRPVVIPWNSGQQFIIFIMYTLASAHIIKCCIDGGPFSYDFIPAVIVLHLLFYSQSIDTLYVLLKNKLPVYAGALLLVLSINVFISYESAVLQAPLGAAFHVCIYTVLFLLIVRKKISRVTAGIMILVCSMYILSYMNLHVSDDIKALLYRIQEGDKVLHYSYPSPLEKKSDLLISDYSSAMRGKRVIEVYKELGDNPFRNRNTALFLGNKSVMNGFIFGLIALKSNDTVDLISNKFVTFQKAIPSLKIKKAVLLKVVFNSDVFPPLWESASSTISENNKYLALYYLNYYFLKHGITEYILIPYYYKDTMK